jgi:hypothetical protein
MRSRQSNLTTYQRFLRAYTTSRTAKYPFLIETSLLAFLSPTSGRPGPPNLPGIPRALALMVP